jgi:hypothetical protein
LGAINHHRRIGFVCFERPQQRLSIDKNLTLQVTRGGRHISRSRRRFLQHVRSERLVRLKTRRTLTFRHKFPVLKLIGFFLLHLGIDPFRRPVRTIGVILRAAASPKIKLEPAYHFAMLKSLTQELWWSAIILENVMVCDDKTHSTSIHFGKVSTHRGDAESDVRFSCRSAVFAGGPLFVIPKVSMAIFSA